MDRSMKVMFGMMTLAICLMAFSMFGNQSTQVYAGEYVGGADRGTEPTIVSFRVTPVGSVESWTSGNGGRTGGASSMFLLTRMWSDGVVEVNLVGSETINNVYDGNGPTYTRFLNADESFTGWKTVKDSPPVNFACTGDVNNDMQVNITDVLAVMSSRGECEGEPMTLSPDPDLM